MTGVDRQSFSRTLLGTPGGQGLGSVSHFYTLL